MSGQAAATAGSEPRKTVRGRVRTGYLGLSRRLRRNALLIDQVLIIVASLVHIGVCLAWINLYLPTFAVYTQDFSFSWFLLAISAVHPAAPLAAVYALKRLAAADWRNWLGLLVCILFVLADIFLLLVGLFMRFIYCPNDMNPPICTPTMSLDAFLYFHVGFLVGDFILVSLMHKLRADINVYTFGPLQMREKRY